RRRMMCLRRMRIGRGVRPFFFQAEDGIRDDLVTGVQTCALPISASCNGTVARPQCSPGASSSAAASASFWSRLHAAPFAGGSERSEERRVGNGRSGGGGAGQGRRSAVGRAVPATDVDETVEERRW